MKKFVALLMFVAITLTACTTTNKKVVEKAANPAPVVDIPVAASSTLPAPAIAESASPEKAAGAYLVGDGPGADTPPNLAEIPDAVPKVEPLHRYANRQYTALGKTYTPLDAPGNFKETGIASWYGKKFHGQRTSIGEVYDMYGMTAAHPILPIPSYARVTNMATKKSVIVRVNDRGPFLHDRIIDLSYTAAYKLGIIDNGSTEVEVESISVDGAAPLKTSTALSVPGKTEAQPVEPTPPVVEVAEIPAPVASSSVPATEGKIYLQLGAFKSPQGAESFLTKMQSKLGQMDKALSLYPKEGLERVHLGPYLTKDEARMAGEKLKIRLGFKPFVSMH